MQPQHGFAAQVAAGSTLYAGTRLGFPISTTHVVSGSVMGAGATRRLSAVRWGVAGNIVFAWLLTLPAAALVAAALYYPSTGSSDRRVRRWPGHAARGRLRAEAVLRARGKRRAGAAVRARLVLRP